MKPSEFREVCKGVFVMMTTPFKENRDLDLDGVKKHTRFLIDRGIVTGKGVLVPTGSTGECPMMTTEEIKSTMKVVIEEAKNKVPVMPTCNSTDTRVSIELARYAQEIGADGVMISPHYYWKPNRALLLSHYQAIANEIDLGIVIDNASFATGADISIPDLELLVKKIPQIIGFKENSSDIGKWDEECIKLADKINFIAGNADCHWPYVGLIGSVGMISAMSNFIPEKIIEIWEAVKNNDYIQAKELHRKLMPISMFNSRFASEKYKSFIKEIMNLMGLPAGPTRLPLVPLSKDEMEIVQKVVSDLKLM
jgi:4-hydroxy-tetrahydrodipicolinate synthase